MIYILAFIVVLYNKDVYYFLTDQVVKNFGQRLKK